MAHDYPSCTEPAYTNDLDIADFFRWNRFVVTQLFVAIDEGEYIANRNRGARSRVQHKVVLQGR